MYILVVVNESHALVSTLLLRVSKHSRWWGRSRQEIAIGGDVRIGNEACRSGESHRDFKKGKGRVKIW